MCCSFGRRQYLITQPTVSWDTPTKEAKTTYETRTRTLAGMTKISQTPQNFTNISKGCSQPILEALAP